MDSEPISGPDLEHSRFEFDREKWQAEHALRRKEVELRSTEINRSRWVNPLVIAVFAAAVAALGNACVTLVSSYQQANLERERATLTQRLNLEQSQATLKLEQTKAEAARILEVVKTNDPDKAAANLKFLLDAGLVVDSRDQIEAYLQKRQPGQGVSLPSPQPSLGESGGTQSDTFARSLAKPAREFITSADANEVVPAHSPIPELLVAALDGAADPAKHGIISTAEIFSYVRFEVMRMHIGISPRMGRLPDPAFAGEFFFRVRTAATGLPDDPLRHGHALIIANGHYQNWPQLPELTKQLSELKAALQAHFDTVELESDLTAERLRARLNGFLRGYGNDREARLFIYYAGHGYTEIDLDRNEYAGYITGVDTPAVDGSAKSLDEARPKALSMREIRGYLEDAPAKKILTVFDSAFAGTIFSIR